MAATQAPATRVPALAMLLWAACSGCGDEPAERQAEPVRAANSTTVHSRLPAPNGTRADTAAAPGDWRLPALDHANTRFSPLVDIDASNVSRLRVAWTFATGLNRGHEAAPLVVGGTMYVVTPFPNILYALDLTRPGAPVKWTYRPDPSPAAQGVACCDVVNRGAAYADGLVVFNTLDVQTVAVDAETGREVWRTRLGDINRGETMTMAPLIVRDRVLVGNSGGEFGVRGWIAGLDLHSGREVWRGYSTGPDAEVLIDESFRPFYDHDRGRDLGVRTWPPEAWKQGGGNVWGWISYDPELDLVYHGTGNAGPWNPELRPGDNKWTAGVFARDPATGQARWFYQWSHHDLYDHDGINENILVDLEINGAPRKVLLHPERNGYVYVLDRATGELLAAEPYHHITASLGVDRETGRLLHNPAKEPRMGRVVREICPAAMGAKDWNPAAFSPQTGFLYIPHNNMCMNWESIEANYIAGTPYVGANVTFHPGPGGHRGEFTAWDPVAGRELWTIRERWPVWSAALATAGGLVFYGTMEGWFKALDARTGELLWRFRTGSGIIGAPMTYRGPDGRQYVAILAGVGGWSGAIVALGLDARDSLAGHGWGATMGGLKEETRPGGMLYVFTLD